MAGKKKSKKSGRKTVSLIMLAGFAPITYETVRGFQDGGLKNAAAVFSRGMTGYDPQQRTFDVNNMKTGIFPIIGAAIIKKIVSILGVNRALAKLPIPIRL